MRASDLGLVRSVSAPALHPSGERVVVSVTHPHLGADATVGQLWNVPVDGSGARRFTHGKADSSPAFSPDGRVLAFLRAGDGPSQIFIVDANGGEPTQLTDQKLGVSEFRWSPDSTRIAFVARVAEQGRYGTVEGIGAGAEPARRITGVSYKANGLGYTIDRRSQVFLVVVPALDVEPSYQQAALPDGTKTELEKAPEATQLTHGDFDTFAPRFLGDRVVFVSARHENRDRDLLEQVWGTVPDGEPEALSAVPGTLSIGALELAEDGAIYLIASDVGESGVDFVGHNSALYRLETGNLTRLTDPANLDFADGAITLSEGAALVASRARGRVQLLQVRGENDSSALASGDVDVQGHAASAGTIVVTFASPTTYGDVAVLRDGQLVPLTDFSAELRATGIVDPVELTVTGRDGYEVHGWVAKPEGDGPHPTLLLIHGGPFADYSVHLFDEVQVYVGAGYAVVYCNPRGSAGYGEDHGKAIKGAMGTVDLNDVLDFLDGALDVYKDLDADRLGILGGSYGGYLTAWTIAHDHRFKAAIVERGFLDPEAFVGSSDIGWFFGQQYTGTDHDAVRAQSPQAVAGQVTTPTLVIHSEQDIRCPIGQAETYYTTLALNGVETEMLIFPGENHELSRSGRPRHRLQRFEAILAWLGSHL